MRSRFLAYGSRASQSKSEEAVKVGQASTYTSTLRSSGMSVGGILDHIATYRVPHSYFTHFYVVSVLSSMFWCAQILTKGRTFTGIASYALTTSNVPSMSVERVALTWSLMTLQGTRRLYECVALTKPSEAKMWVGHWLIGIGFYIAMGAAVWVEGIRESTINSPILLGRANVDINSHAPIHRNLLINFGHISAFSAHPFLRSSVPNCVRYPT